MRVSRRRFLGTGISLGASLTAFRCSGHFGDGPAGSATPDDVGYGPLQPDPSGVIDLPEGFTYRIVSRTGETMDDGLLVPGAHDGMAAFAGPGGTTLLVRNHELLADDEAGGPFGPERALRSQIDLSMLYDSACVGGTTNLVYDTGEQRLVEHYLSLAGTVRNCAGGPTPWNTWVTCEESVQRSDDVHQRDHGFNFEVAADAGGLVRPVALRAMGRFNHEAIAVDAASGVVYQTEDRGDSLFYRFIPDRAGNLADGGRLQALKISDMDGVDTSNHETATIEPGSVHDVEWVDLEDAESPLDDLRMQGAARGAALFSRGEGIVSGPGEVYFAATSGGPNQAGQLFRYRPSPAEGTAGELDRPGTLELFVEPNDTNVLDQVDNIAIAPWGDLILCEDGPGENFVRGVTPAGAVYSLIRNAMNDSEFAGATFSPDGTTLFVNIQRPGLTLAITGPWV